MAARQTRTATNSRPMTMVFRAQSTTMRMFWLDEWCHAHLPRWLHRWFCDYVDRRIIAECEGGN